MRATQMQASEEIKWKLRHQAVVATEEVLPFVIDELKKPGGRRRIDSGYP